MWRHKIWRRRLLVLSRGLMYCTVRCLGSRFGVLTVSGVDWSLWHYWKIRECHKISNLFNLEINTLVVQKENWWHNTNSYFLFPLSQRSIQTQKYWFNNDIGRNWSEWNAIRGGDWCQSDVTSCPSLEHILWSLSRTNSSSREEHVWHTLVFVAVLTK